MRLFLDANIMTYIAFFEEYMIEGGPEEWEQAIQDWMTIQQSVADDRLLHEVKALRVLYLIDEQASFDWMFSDVALQEISEIRSALKRDRHRDLLGRLIEHRNDAYYKEEPVWELEDLDRKVAQLFPGLPEKMRNDARQYCEALLYEASYFLTNDAQFARTVEATRWRVAACRVSELPFVAEVLARWNLSKTGHLRIR